MTNINQLKKELDDGKMEVLSKYSKYDLMRKISNLCDTYYISYINDDEDAFRTASSMLDDLAAASEIIYPNVNSYIHDCMLRTINRLFNELMPRKYLLLNPEAVSIDVIYQCGLWDAVKKANAERVIIKRNDNYDG